jgi:hypothetical protein
MNVLWVVMPFNLVVFQTVAGGRSFIRNNGEFLLEYTSSRD